MDAREADRAARLLRSCGVKRDLADQHAQLGFRVVACHVAAWQIARKRDPTLSPGALVDRLDNWGEQPLADWDAMRAGVLGTHVTEQDLTDWGLAKVRNPLDPYDAPPGYEGIIKH